ELVAVAGDLAPGVLLRPDLQRLGLHVLQFEVVLQRLLSAVEHLVGRGRLQLLGREVGVRDEEPALALLEVREEHLEGQPAGGLGLLDRGAGKLRGELPFLLVLLVVLAGEAGGARRQHRDRENRPHHVLRGTYLVTWNESRNAVVSLWLTNAS